MKNIFDEDLALLFVEMAADESARYIENMIQKRDTERKESEERCRRITEYIQRTKR